MTKDKTRYHSLLVLAVVTVGVTIVVRTAGNDSPRRAPAPAATTKDDQDHEVGPKALAKPKAELSPIMGDSEKGVVLKIKMEPSGDNALSASVKCAPWSK